MIVDTSAVMAVLEREPEGDAVAEALAVSPATRISAVTLVELTAVVQRYGRVEVHRKVDRLLQTWGVETVPFDSEQSRIARQAYRDYGRGSGHPAQLNLGDCFSYALATVTGDPLLYVGQDFAATDIPPALPKAPG
ncbi:type II toxin-antitoxin system VapC family toxin [Microbacterium sp.]|uniref:type II toxin-antitoxin system VapC family toxin n=1 Tax=Microbacterium sp. TaxID=51671 RepID=UPI0039E6378E